MGISAILKNVNGFYEWQRQNRLYGKRISILGDSISTFEGYNPEGYKVFYDKEKQLQAGICQVSDTWWQTVIDFFGGELLVNNSWSGSRVTKLPGSEQMFPSGCSDERTTSLHILDKMPDAVIVYLGTNDWGFGAKTGNETHLLGEDDFEFFDLAYERMLNKIKSHYPQSEIFCCTLCETCISKQPGFQFPHSHAGTHIEEYNEIIRNIVRRYGYTLIDLYMFKMPYDSIDGSHPNQAGMNAIATMVIRSIVGFDADKFLDCEGQTSINNSDDEINFAMGEKVMQDRYVGKIIGERYSVQKLIGSGGFYTTYLVQDIKSNKTWAMKACDKTDKNYSPIIRENILQEPHIMMKLKHPAIPSVLDIVEDDESIFIVREYVEGVALESVVRDLGPQPAGKVIEWGKQLCDMLGYLHKLTPPHIYRDMKPANIILTPDGSLMVIDFGIIRIYDFMKNSDTCFLGTRGYAAPEQYGGMGQSDARTDIFGLGMTMHRLVTGVDPNKPPYETKPICQVNPNLPKGLEYIISKCTQLDPDERYQNCDELLADLNNYLNLPKPKGIFRKLFGKK